jgi:hypothetical protein
MFVVLTDCHHRNNLDFPSTLNNIAFRSALGKAAKNEKKPWFKDISRGELLAEILGPTLKEIRGSPLAVGLSTLRKWIDG